MPLFNDVDLGPSNPYKIPKSGMHVGVVEIPGGYAVPYGIDSTHPAWQATFWFQAQSAVGQYAAGTQKAVEYLGRQLEELSRNPDLQPCYVQLFNGTNLPVATWAQPQDGFYYITGCTIDYSRSLQGFCRAQVDLEYVSPGPPRRVGISSYGAGLTTTYSGAAINWAGFPLNSSDLTFSQIIRTGGEGAVPVIVGPPTGYNPLSFLLSSTVSDWFKCGVRVYDVMAGIGTNPVPTGGAIVHANWVEVKGPDHKFVGDMVITNGLQLLVFTLGVAAQICTPWLWNTSLITPAWQQYGTLNYQESGGGSTNGVLRSISLTKVGMEEVVVQTESSTAGGNLARVTLRLQRGAYHVRMDFRPLTQANTNANSLGLTSVASLKAVYNSTSSVDAASGSGGLTIPTDYGYGAAFTNNSAQPFVMGLLWTSPPNSAQPNVSSATFIGIGETTGPALNATRSYGFFAIPWTAPQNLQFEMESGTLTGGMVSAADAAASNGNTAKIPNTTAAGAQSLGGAFVPLSGGTYQAWFRVKVTSAASATAQLQLGMYDNTGAAIAVSTTYAPTGLSTSYIWVKGGAALTTAGHNYSYFALGINGAAVTDYFIDEAVLVPVTGGSYFPQDLWQQYIYDRTTKLRLT